MCPRDFVVPANRKHWAQYTTQRQTPDQTPRLHSACLPRGISVNAASSQQPPATPSSPAWHSTLPGPGSAPPPPRQPAPPAAMQPPRGRGPRVEGRAPRRPGPGAGASPGRGAAPPRGRRQRPLAPGAEIPRRSRHVPLPGGKRCGMSASTGRGRRTPLSPRVSRCTRTRGAFAPPAPQPPPHSHAGAQGDATNASSAARRTLAVQAAPGHATTCTSRRSARCRSPNGLGSARVSISAVIRWSQSAASRSPSHTTRTCGGRRVV